MVTFLGRDGHRLTNLANLKYWGDAFCNYWGGWGPIIGGDIYPPSPLFRHRCVQILLYPTFLTFWGFVLLLSYFFWALSYLSYFLGFLLLFSYFSPYFSFFLAFFYYLYIYNIYTFFLPFDIFSYFFSPQSCLLSKLKLL